MPKKITLKEAKDEISKLIDKADNKKWANLRYWEAYEDGVVAAQNIVERIKEK